tara:strand:+ start:4280 stop:5041 length:762 start_codon:yes stop_codon:yes gene_type:complete
MKCALLLSGIVGRVYKNKSKFEYENDVHVDFRIGHHFYKKNIFNVNDEVDVFIHSWDEKFEKELVQLYKPKKSKFQKQIVFNENKYRHNAESRWYSTMEVTKLKKEYEEENDFVYDVVMSSRFDIGFFKALDFGKFIDLDTSVYVPAGLPYDPNKKSVLDYWHFSSSKNMDVINNFHPHFKEYGMRSPHKDLYQWPVDNNIKVCRAEDFQDSEIGNGNTDIVRAIFENCEYKYEEFDIKKLKKLDKYPRGGRF